MVQRLKSEPSDGSLKKRAGSNRDLSSMSLATSVSLSSIASLSPTEEDEDEEEEEEASERLKGDKEDEEEEVIIPLKKKAVAKSDYNHVEKSVSSKSTSKKSIDDIVNESRNPLSSAKRPSSSQKSKSDKPLMKNIKASVDSITSSKSSKKKSTSSRCSYCDSHVVEIADLKLDLTRLRKQINDEDHGKAEARVKTRVSIFSCSLFSNIFICVG